MSRSDEAGKLRGFVYCPGCGERVEVASRAEPEGLGVRVDRDSIVLKVTNARGAHICPKLS